VVFSNLLAFKNGSRITPEIKKLIEKSLSIEQDSVVDSSNYQDYIKLSAKFIQKYGL